MIGNSESMKGRENKKKALKIASKKTMAEYGLDLESELGYLA